MHRGLLFIPALFILFMLPSIASASLSVPLSVTDYAGIGRVQDPVTSGVPLPNGSGITSTSQLRITDSAGNPIPAQLAVLARWNGLVNDSSKPIKWVLMDFQADTPANGTSIYYLKDTGQYSFASSLSVQDLPSMITVSTGKAKFQISKSYFNLFDYVWIDKDGDGQVDDPIISSPGQGGLVLTDENGTRYYTTLEAPENITIEESGPMRTVVLIRGVFKSQSGAYYAPKVCHSAAYPAFCQPYPHSFVYYNARIFFYNNKDYARIFLTLENNGANGRTNPEPYFAPIQVTYFSSVNLILGTSFSQTNILSQDSSTQLSPGDNFTLYQDWHENLADSTTDTLETAFNNGIFYTTRKNSQQLSSGLTNPGWIDTNDNSQGIGLAIRQFWQNFPKKITINTSETKVGFWPEEGYYPYCRSADFSSQYDMYCKNGGRDAHVYLFDGGRHKTYEFILRFYAGAQDSQTQYLSKSMEEPLMALAPSDWYVQTMALGPIAPYGMTSTDPKLNEAMQRFEQLQSAMVYPGDSQNGVTIDNIKTKSPPDINFPDQDRFFGWMGFGDLVWEGSHPSSLHYDWTYDMLLNYIRSGKRGFFDEGVEMAKHRYDIDQYHGDRTDTGGNQKYRNYFQFYESDGHADPNMAYSPSFVSIPTHTWNGGIILYYLLTGDRKAWEAAVENGKGALDYFGPGGLQDASVNGCANDEARYEGWSMVSLINLYRVSGDPLYLNTAKNIAKNRILYREQQVGGEGNIGGDAISSTTQNALMASNGYVNWPYSGVPYDPSVCQASGCSTCKNFNFPLMTAYISEGLIQTQYETQDPAIGNLIIRIADFLRTKMIFGGDLNGNGNYRVNQVIQAWTTDDPNGSIRNAQKPAGYGGGSQAIYDLFWNNYFGYAYSLTGNPVYLDWSRKTFEDMMLYYALPVGGYINPNSRAVISYTDSMFPGSYTKVHGWIGRSSEIYLSVESTANGIIPLSITTSSLPNGQTLSAYSQALSASGGTSPYTWSLISGSLPPGLSLSPAGLISGTPTTTGTFSFTVQLTDSASNTTTKALSITVNVQDTTPPTLSNGQPSGTLQAGTTQVTLSLTTNENSGCRYSSTTGVAYSSMTSLFSTTGGTSHSTTMSGLQDGHSYTYYIRCQDSAGNPDTSDFPISFSVASAGPTCQSQGYSCCSSCQSGPHSQYDSTCSASQACCDSCSQPPQPQGLCAGLVLLHHYDNNPAYGESATKAYDFSGNGNNGTCAGASCPIATSGKFSGAFQYDGASNYMNVPYRQSLELPDSGGTASAWIYIDPSVTLAQNTYMGIFRKAIHSNWDAPGGYSLGLYQAGPSDPHVLRALVGGWNSVDDIKGTTGVTNGQWHHVALTWDTSTLNIYLDGSLEKSSARTKALSYAIHTEPLRIGYPNGGTGTGTLYFRGMADDFALWNRTLSSQDVQQLYSSNSPISCANKADTNQDGCISMAELTAFISRWQSNSSDVSLKELMDAIGLWKSGGCP